MNDETTSDPIGWTIVATGDDGSVLCESPSGNRRRYWFEGKRSVQSIFGTAKLTQVVNDLNDEVSVEFDKINNGDGYHTASLIVPTGAFSVRDRLKVSITKVIDG